ncbi:MAG TPA: hypothetical protein VFT65_15110 [Candidatus Angelobacter sp.]|nr:hypothetical protein [Candidatus Angelobacter sp.]
MRSIFLLGANYLRSQWIPLAIMTAYMLGIGGVFGAHAQRSEVLFFLRWHAAYAIFLGTVVAIPALQMERKTRRVLAVLSKGIYRWQYIGGLLCGCTMISALFCLLVGAIAAWVCRQGGVPVDGLAEIIIALFCCCVASAATGLFFSAFLHPFLSMAATSVVLFLPIALERQAWRPLWGLFPVASMFRWLMRFQLQPAGPDIWMIAGTALLQAALFWLAAAVVFARKDVTISPE